MKMSLLLVGTLLIGCSGGAVTKPDPPAPVEKREVVVKDAELRRELKKLLKDCQVTEVPEEADDKPITDVAVDLANARKADLKECNIRLRKARSKL